VKIRQSFHIDVNGPEDTSTKRSDAFFLPERVDREQGGFLRRAVRRDVLANARRCCGIPSGIVSLCRVVVCCDPNLAMAADVLLIGGLLVALLASFRSKKFLIPVLVAACASGYLLGYGHPPQSMWGAWVAMMLASALFSRWSYVAFKRFALEFPKAIYRDFYTYEPKKDPSKSKDGDGDI